MVKGHAKKRQREWLRLLRGTPKATNKPNLAGWKELERRFTASGTLGTVAHGGGSLVAVNAV